MGAARSLWRELPTADQRVGGTKLKAHSRLFLFIAILVLVFPALILGCGGDGQATGADGEATPPEGKFASVSAGF